MEFIDTHTHLYSEAFDSDIDQVIESCIQKGIKRLLLTNIDVTSVEVMTHLHSKYPSVCHKMMGLHPCSVKEDYQEQLKELKLLLEKQPEDFCAVGEIGTDLYWDKTFEREMEIAFREQIDWAIEFNKPIVIHSRDSLDWSISIVSEIKRKHTTLRGVFHCFNGTVEQGLAIHALDFMMGVGGVITYKNAHLSEVFAALPLESLVLETDSPYLAPVPYRGKRNSSEYIPVIAEKLAEAKDLPLSQIATVTTENAKKLFSLT